MTVDKEIESFAKIADTIMKIENDNKAYNEIMLKADEIEKLEKKLDKLYKEQRQRLRKQILESAIQKAIDGGWLDGESALSQIKGTPDFAIDGLSNNIIFNHNFAKALWGDKPIVEYFGYTSKDIRPAYAYHLRQMAISGDAIIYLGGTL